MRAQFQLFHSAQKLVSSFVVGIFLASACLPGSPATAAPSGSDSPNIETKNVQTTNPQLVPPTSRNTAFGQLDLYANIETIGVSLNGTDLSKTAELMYRQVNEANWHTGHPLMRSDDGRLIGSLFGLAPSTTYEIKVRDGTAEISGTTTTQPNELQGHMYWSPMGSITKRSPSRHRAAPTTGSRSRRRAVARFWMARKPYREISGNRMTSRTSGSRRSTRPSPTWRVTSSASICTMIFQAC